ncbi:hypothetical protein DOTSEDRAFT_62545 [Dothistroma septosporum NZE10]|uniref:Enoyl reductase (ER) domain-containing protein n=1 Tax=Dothistroma septosporum (strain NZE10 / CBS 128990) TaxID=675120 RepID=N1PNQ5_DOTSN|nr:hypothetical protein DOTSEDRAFT_62545 [Dothistroma septosporum NZE10]
MKAVVIYQPGGPEVLNLEQRPVPTPQPDWALTRVKAFGLNRSKQFTRQGHMFDGGYAEYTCAPVGQVQRLKTKLSWDVLGGCGAMLQTAYGSLFTSLQLQKGEKLLIRGGTTRIGLAAAAVAQNHGVEVLSTTRSASREGLLKRAGVSKVIIDTGAIAEQVRRQTNGTGVNKVLELIGTTTLLDPLECAAPQGIVCMICMVGNSWPSNDFEPMGAILHLVCLTTYSGGSEDFMKTPLQEPVDQIEAGTLPITIGMSYKLDEIVEAHRTTDENRAGGSIVVLT